MSAYSSSLDSTRKEIRRLILQPGSDDSDIQCSTETVSLIDLPYFEALSYVWGDASAPGEEIILNGVPFRVTENLAAALRRLRQPDKQRILWIDALCINQNDTHERNKQVEMMGQIYKDAKLVLIFLGEDVERKDNAGMVWKESDDAFELMSEIVIDPSSVPEDKETELFSFFLLHMATRPWFGRLWIVQELCLSGNDPLVGCGAKWIPWSVFTRAWEKVALSEFQRMGMAVSAQMSDTGKGLQDVRQPGVKIDLLNTLRTSVITKGSDEFRNLLLNTQSSQCTEPKDRIYALLGMMQEDDRKLITVDYARSLETVYTEAISLLFQRTNGPFFLSGVELAGPNYMPSCPSWVPRFGSNTLPTPTRFHPAGVGVSGPGNECENGIVTSDLTTLRVRGLYIDVVVDKITFEKSGKCLNQLPQVESLAAAALQLAASHESDRPYLDAFKKKEPLWRTLIANKAHSGATREAAPEAYGDMYKVVVDKLNSNDPKERRSAWSNDDYFKRLFNQLPLNTFFITKTGFCGIGASNLEKGDHLAIWFGAPVPFVLRQNKDQAKEKQEGEFACSVVGVAYVAGIMDGEMVDEVYCEDLEDDVIFVVQ